MKVKVGDRIYDSEKEPIMLILSPDNKANIAKMHPAATQFCSYPKWMGSVELVEWMSRGEQATTKNLHANDAESTDDDPVEGTDR